MNLNICILDSGEYYIISVINDTYEIVKHLYSLIGITINKINTDIFVNKETLDYIYESIGKVIFYDTTDYINESIGRVIFHDTTITKLPKENVNLLLKLKIDISKIIEFVQVRKFWESLQYPLKAYERKTNETKADEKPKCIPLTVEDLLPNNIDFSYKYLSIKEDIKFLLQYLQ